MRTLPLATILVALLLVTSGAEAKRKKNKSASSDLASTKTKTKTKWSSSTDLGAHSQNSMVATEEHGYYVKRTFLPITGKTNSSLKSPPFLAVPIAWFPCQDADCAKLNSLAINSNKNSLAEGFLCDDDCAGPYEPICGKTSSEVAVFYNKCKLNVAKCRSHGYWTDLPYEECQKQYAEEVKYAEMKFRANPFFTEKVMEPPKGKDTTMTVVLDEKQPAKEIATNIPVEVATEQVLIKEMHEKEPQTKQKVAKDHYEEIKNTKVTVDKKL